MTDTAPTRRTQVFLSYSRHDRVIAEEIKISLETCGFEVVYDQEDIASGEPWEPRLRSLIDSADTTVCVLTENWIASTECVKELGIAEERGRRVLPVVPEGLDFAKAPPELASRQFILFYGEGKSFARGIADLVDALNTDLDWVRQQSRLLALASDWDASGQSDALRLRGESLEAAKDWMALEAPRDVKVLPLVATFIAASEDGEQDDQRQKLRGRLRQIALGALAVIGLLGAGAATLWGELRTSELELQIAENDAFAATVGAPDCGAFCATTPEPGPPDTAPAEEGPAVPEEPELAIVTEGEQTAANTLVSNLDDSDRAVRLQAGQQVADALRTNNDPAILRALVGQLKRPARDTLSASGRFNMLYMLNSSGGWAEAGVSDDVADVVKDIKAREADGVAVGPQTQDCVDKLQARVDGQTETSRRCGGR